MPGKVKVRVLAGRNLPVMDRSSDTTDAYVEVKLANTTYKTDVYRKSLNPQWNSEWFIFEVDDLELQDEPLQIRLMDHDTYSANDAIGKVYVDLNPLLLIQSQPSQGKNLLDGNMAGATVMSGWLPVYDTMHGIRGEVNILVKVDLFSDFNKFRQSSCGVQFFFTPGIPIGFRCNSIIGFVEELVVNDDPEYKWIDKIRTPRASNEARQTLFSKLSGELQRRIGLKVLEKGGNAVVGYRLCFDLEGESGIVVRGIGSVVSLARIIYDNPIGVTSTHSPSPLREFAGNQKDLVENSAENSRSGLSPSAASPKRCSRSRKTSTSYSMSRSPQLQEGVDLPMQSSHTSVSNQSPTHSIKLASPSHTNGVYINRRSSDSDLSITPKGGSLTGSGGSSLGGALSSCPKPLMTQESFDNLIYPFLTMKSFPPGFIIHIGGTVCSRSVQLLDRGHLPEEVETRDSWWSDLRTEIRSHARSIGCNVVIGYEEFTSISEDVCLLNAVGTAAVINVRYQDMETLTRISQKGGWIDPMSVSLEKKDFDLSPHQMCTNKLTSTKEPPPGAVAKSHYFMMDEVNETSAIGALPRQPMAAPASGPRHHPCSMCHIPYVEEVNTQKSSIPKCAICRKHNVNDVLLATIEIPPNMPITGRGCLLQARVIRAKKDLKGEANAREMSDAMPFLEYDLHKQLYQKLMIKGLNGLFALRIRVTIGEKFIIGIGTGTGVYLTALPAPKMPRIVSRLPVDECRTVEMQKKIQSTFERNKGIYGVNDIPGFVANGSNHLSDSKESDTEDSEEEFVEVDVPSNKDMYDLDLNDLEDVEMINLLLEESPPSHVVAVTSQMPPGISPEPNGKNLQMFTRVWRTKLPSTPNRILFSSYFNKMLQSIYFKLRNLYPCILSGLQVSVELPEEDEVQITIFGMVLGQGATPSVRSKTIQSPIQKSSENIQLETKFSKQDDCDLIFRMDEVGPNEETVSTKQLASIRPLKAFSYISNLSSSSSKNTQTAHSDFSSFATVPSVASISSGSSSGRSSFKLKSDKAMLQHHFQCPPQSDHFGVEITPLSFIPGAKIERHLGNLNFFFIRESTNIKENGGLNGFMGSFVTEVLALVRAHVAAIGGNAMISYFLSECVLLYNPHKSQGQCLINVGGDVVFIHYPTVKNVSDRNDTCQLANPTDATPAVF